MKPNLNFASRRYVNRQAVSRGYWVAASGLLVLLLWAVIQSLATQSLIQESQSQLAALEQDEMAILGTQYVPFDSQKIVTMQAEIARSQKLLDQDAFHWTALFDRIEQLLPEGVSVRGFRPDYEKRTLAIDGIARDLTSLQNLLDRMLAATTISNAYLNRHSYSKTKDDQGVEHPILEFSVNLEGVF